MDAKEVLAVRARFGWTQADLAERAGVVKRTVAYWESGAKITPQAEAKVRAAESAALAELPSSPSLADEVAELRQRVDYLEAIVLTNRVDELAARRQAHAERPILRGVADSHIDADLHGEGNQEEP